MWLGGRQEAVFQGQEPALLPERGASALAHPQQGLACHRQKPMRPSVSGALQLRKAISFANMETVKKRGAAGLCRMCQGSKCSVQLQVRAV